MAKKRKLEPSVPSKAYLVSFGDTMTALLAFFIVLNSLAKEQTGANMYSGTGSFVSAFTNSGSPGDLTGNRSRDVLQQKQQKPLYALAENLDQNDLRVGPDDTDENQRILDRDQEQFQKFLSEIERQFGLKSNLPIQSQTVFDSFQPWDRKTDSMSTHAIQLLSGLISKLRQPDTSLEIIIWATMPSKRNLEQQLAKSIELRSHVEQVFWLKPSEKKRIRYSVKPWLFADAKRPVLSVVYSKSGI
jgi:flagellar motor protein MotB